MRRLDNYSNSEAYRQLAHPGSVTNTYNDRVFLSSLCKLLHNYMYFCSQPSLIEPNEDNTECLFELSAAEVTEFPSFT